MSLRTVKPIFLNLGRPRKNYIVFPPKSDDIKDAHVKCDRTDGRGL